MTTIKQLSGGKCNNQGERSRLQSDPKPSSALTNMIKLKVHY